MSKDCRSCFGKGWVRVPTPPEGELEWDHCPQCPPERKAMLTSREKKVVAALLDMAGDMLRGNDFDLGLYGYTEEEAAELDLNVCHKIGGGSEDYDPSADHRFSQDDMLALYFSRKIKEEADDD